eukprot:CAMPEP_0174341748 /NCGR_PEP_ID=MMETSP0810-20121108/25669_1 /TAXON_ID=73025 ORGANISM="Eutreptiella gymnastica-like, Strain CCMP1594" /NCGR_SAMPLE_ID=MMETSP0810 /ASSEMBLY_ACC=CAM_ASM_000659 /LENGTH=120 /DNA_ID=CAMNT_0015463589 /DNA_START=1253 /DNA_END=1612 /DNA_ORIENTATION=-
MGCRKKCCLTRGGRCAWRSLHKGGSLKPSNGKEEQQPNPFGKNFDAHAIVWHLDNTRARGVACVGGGCAVGHRAAPCSARCTRESSAAGWPVRRGMAAKPGSEKSTEADRCARVPSCALR